MKITIKLDTRKAKSQGVYPIKYAVSHNQKTAYILTPYSCKVAEWNDKAGELRSSHPHAAEWNTWLKTRLYDYQQRMLRLSPSLSVAEIRDKLMATTTDEHTFRMVYEEHQARYEGKTLQQYKYAWGKIQAFHPNTQWEDINYGWLTDFANWMRKHEGLSIDTASMVLRSLRAVCNYAYKCGYVQSYAFLRYSIQSTPASQRRKRTMALSDIQLRNLFSMDLSDSPALEWAVSVLWVSFLLGGMNLIDLYGLKELKEDCSVEYVREKIKRYEPEPVRLDLSMLNEPDLSRLKALASDGWLVDHCGKRYEGFYNTHKKALQRLSRLLGYRVSLYSVRYSWATIAASLGVPVSVINRVQAHTDGGGNTFSERFYINFDWSQASEAVARVAEYMQTKEGDSH